MFRTALLICAALAMMVSAPVFAEAPPAQAAAKVAAPSAKSGAAAAAKAAPPRDLSRYKEESVSGGSLLLAAYMIMWALVGTFVGRTLLRQAKVEAELTELSERVDVLTGGDAA
ncbi:MAG: hypothetical protein KC502_04255 [Myxococcales bacterium]|nr:hypothetical protein [Myxococcales bacterium]